MNGFGMQKRQSARCSLDFDLVYPEEYNEDVKPELLSLSLLLPLPIVNWNNLEKLSRSLVNADQIIFSKSESKAKGDETENEFFQLCEKNGLKYEKASSSDDYYNHYDCKIFTDDIYEIRIDIKSMKSLRRHGPQQNKYFFVELNLEGWLFFGLANYIAIQYQPNIFLIYEKEKLKEYVRKTVQFTLPVVAWPEQSLNRVYVRKSENHSSVLSLVSTMDAFKFAGVGKFC